MDRDDRRSFQPKDLLNLAIEAKTSTNAPTDSVEMSDERRKWLQEAMGSVWGQNSSPVQHMKSCLAVLQSKDSVNEPKNSAFDVLMDLTETIDNADDFHKIGGFPVILEFLTGSDANLRRQAAELFAQLMQNNPYCQDKALTENFLPLLLELMEKEESNATRVKILSAISSLLRSNTETQTAFEKCDGFSVLLRCIMTCKDEKFQTSAAFMLGRICNQNPRFSDYLANMGFIHSFVALLQQDDQQPSAQLREHLTEVLAVVLRDSELARKEASQTALNLVQYLEERRKVIAGADEYLEESQSIDAILKTLTASEDSNSNGDR